jgi:hypothetical protein
MINVISLVLTLLGGVLASAKANNVAQEVIQGIEAAIAALAKVHDTPVTYEQLESLRVKPQW